MDIPFDSQPLAKSLIDLVLLAAHADRSDDAAALMAGLKVLRPRLAELDLLEADLLMLRHQYREALLMLRGIEGSPTHGAIAKAMGATCLRLLQDPEWQVRAHEVQESAVAGPARALVERLLQGPSKPGETVENESDVEKDTSCAMATATAVSAAQATASPDAMALHHLRA